MKVADIMARDVVVVRPDASVREVATLMLERRISGVPVVDDGGRVLGIVSEGDLIRRPEVGTDRAAVRLMERHGIKRLPVVEQGRLAGLMTRADIVRGLLRQQPVAAPASTDRELRKRIEALLRDQGWAASAYIHVVVEAGVVQLWGTVESEAQREAVLLAVAEVDGVKDVQAHLGRTLPG